MSQTDKIKEQEILSKIATLKEILGKFVDFEEKTNILRERFNKEICFDCHEKLNRRSMEIDIQSVKEAINEYRILLSTLRGE